MNYSKLGATCEKLQNWTTSPASTTKNGKATGAKAIRIPANTGDPRIATQIPVRIRKSSMPQIWSIAKEKKFLNMHNIFSEARASNNIWVCVCDHVTVRKKWYYSSVIAKLVKQNAASKMFIQCSGVCFFVLKKIWKMQVHGLHCKLYLNSIKWKTSSKCECIHD